jgi:hypothetical protein
LNPETHKEGGIMAWFMESSKAVKAAAEMQENDSEWTYEAIDHGNGLATIEVREGGILLGTM